MRGGAIDTARGDVISEGDGVPKGIIAAQGKFEAGLAFFGAMAEPRIASGLAEYRHDIAGEVHEQFLLHSGNLKGQGGRMAGQRNLEHGLAIALWSQHAPGSDGCHFLLGFIGGQSRCVDFLAIG